MTLLKEYLKSQILKLEGTQVQEIQAKSNILVHYYFKISKADLHIKDIPLSAKDIINLDSMFAQLFQNKPVQYIIGETYFYNDQFLTPPGVFIPRPESELLVDCAVEFLSKSKDNLKIIDFCTGSGCILLSIAKKFPKHEYIGLDKSKLAIKTAKKNRELLGLKKLAGYTFWLVLLSVGTFLIFVFLMSEMGTLVKIATILSFITAPIYAILNFSLVNSKFMPKNHKLKIGMKIYSILGIIFLSFFSIWYLTLI